LNDVGASISFWDVCSLMVGASTKENKNPLEN